MDIIRELVKKRVLDKEKIASLEYEAKTSGKTAEELLLSRKLIPELSLFEFKSKQIGIPLIKVLPENIESGILKLIPENTANYYKVIPISRKDNVVKIGMVYPEDIKARQALNFLAREGQFSYDVFLITLSEHTKVLKKYRSMVGEVRKALEELEIEIERGERIEPGLLKKDKWGELIEEAPISKIVAVLLKHAVEGNASDIHIEPSGDKLRVRFRVLGDLHSSIFLPISYLSSLVARVKILANLRIDETRMPQDGRFSAKIENRKIDFRVSTFPTVIGEKVVIRVLDPKMGLKSFHELGIEKRSLRVIRKATEKLSGMILVTGPTGSGKTTTLYAILQELNKEKTNIVTLEDPVEYIIRGVNQSQVKTEIGYTFAKGLRYILRQDPDIVLVGEMRDTESAKLGVRAALTGHLVLSTLHTTNVLSVIPRLIDLGIEPYLIPVALNLVLSQRLVRKLCDNCKKKVKAQGKIKEFIFEELEKLPPARRKELKIPKSPYVWQSVGCKKCQNRGYSGRIGVFEVLEMTDQLAELTLSRAPEKDIAEEAFRQGMITMRQDALLKALKGLTTIEEAIRTTG